MILGLQSATADYACTWRKIHKANRWEVDKTIEYFNTPPLGRTLKEIQTMCKQKPNKANKNNYGCTNPPLIKIDLDHMVVDELHLMLRITDNLDEIDRIRGEQRNIHLTKTRDVINSMGISFNVCEKKIWMEKLEVGTIGQA